MALLLLVYTLRHGMLKKKKSKQTKKKNKNKQTKRSDKLTQNWYRRGSIPIAVLGMLVVMSRR